MLRLIVKHYDTTRLVGLACSLWRVYPRLLLLSFLAGYVYDLFLRHRHSYKHALHVLLLVLVWRVYLSDPSMTKYVLFLPFAGLTGSRRILSVTVCTSTYFLYELTSLYWPLGKGLPLVSPFYAFGEFLVGAILLVSYALSEVYSAALKGDKKLHEAVRTGHFKSVCVALKKTKNINAVNGDHATALHICAQRGLYRIARLLVEAGADVNAQDKIGFIPLHWAVQMRKEEIDPTPRLKIIELLLTHHAEYTKKAVQGKTPIDIARNRNNRRALETIERYMKSNDVSNEVQWEDDREEVTPLNS